MQIEYLGHASFWFKDRAGNTALIDPYDDTVGYRVPQRRAAYTMVTHDHWDHGNVRGVPGATQVIAGSGRRGTEAFPVRAVLAFHDDQGGRRHGLVNIMCFAMDGVRVCHLSDLGHVLAPDQVAEIGPVDVLMVPVGGGSYTIDGATAQRVVEQLQPRIAIPMHYMTAQTNRLDFPIDGVEPFLRNYPHVETVRSGVLEVTPQSLPIRFTVYVLTNTM